MCCGLKFFWFSEDKNKYLRKSHTVEQVEKILDNENYEGSEGFGCLFLIKLKNKKNQDPLLYEDIEEDDENKQSSYENKF